MKRRRFLQWIVGGLAAPAIPALPIAPASVVGEVMTATEVNQRVIDYLARLQIQAAELAANPPMIIGPDGIRQMLVDTGVPTKWLKDKT